MTTALNAVRTEITEAEEERSAIGNRLQKLREAEQLLASLNGTESKPPPLDSGKVKAERKSERKSSRKSSAKSKSKKPARRVSNGDPLAVQREAVREYIADHPDGCSAADIFKDTGIPTWKVRELLPELMEAGQVRTEGKGRGRRLLPGQHEPSDKNSDHEAANPPTDPPKASAGKGRYQPKPCVRCGVDFLPTGPRSIYCGGCADKPKPSVKPAPSNGNGHHPDDLEVRVLQAIGENEVTTADLARATHATEHEVSNACASLVRQEKIEADRNAFGKTLWSRAGG